jgi:hypothetical protein
MTASGQRSAGTLPSEVSLADVLGRSEVVLVDFDGPICSVFAGYPPAAVADAMRDAIADHVRALPSEWTDSPNPHLLLRWLGANEPTLVATAEEALAAPRSTRSEAHDQRPVQTLRSSRLPRAGG